MPGTNAVYTFKKSGPEGQDQHLYDNCDAYPSGAASKLLVAYEQSQVQLARRSQPTTSAMLHSLAVGDIPDSYEQLMLTSDWRNGPSTNFRYEIEERAGDVHVAVLCPDLSGRTDSFKLPPGQNFLNWSCEFSGVLREFADWAREHDGLEA